MNDVFTYEWHELTKGRRLTPKIVLQAVLLSIIVGFGPELVCTLLGYGSRIDVYQIRFMVVAVPVILAISILPYWKNPVNDVTTSSLTIDTDTVRITRHTISGTSRRLFVTWDSTEITECKFDELHRVIQLNGTWITSAYRMKGTKPGPFIDSFTRTQKQTFQLSPETFYKALDYLKEHYADIVSPMDSEEYQNAKPFIHKHYEI